MHTPVLLDSAIEGLGVKKSGKYIDATAGEGGHLRKMLEKGGEVLAIDWDKNQIERLKEQIKSDKVRFDVGNFANIGKLAEKNKFTQVDGILFDLGLSMFQISSGKRGFSFKNDEEDIDMRLSTRAVTKASDIVNVLEESQLYKIFTSFGEEIYSLPIAQSIVQRRVKKKIHTVGELKRAIDFGLKIKGITSDHDRHKSYIRIFQALRIAVNSEFDNLVKGLKQATRLVKKGGRIAVITFHSREDRIVKQFMREHKLRDVNKKSVGGNRALKFERSARLRVIEL